MLSILNSLIGSDSQRNTQNYTFMKTEQTKQTEQDFTINLLICIIIFALLTSL